MAPEAIELMGLLRHEGSREMMWAFRMLFRTFTFMRTENIL